MERRARARSKALSHGGEGSDDDDDGLPRHDKMISSHALERKVNQHLARLAQDKEGGEGEGIPAMPGGNKAPDGDEEAPEHHRRTYLEDMQSDPAHAAAAGEAKVSLLPHREASNIDDYALNMERIWETRLAPTDEGGDTLSHISLPFFIGRSLSTHISDDKLPKPAPRIEMSKVEQVMLRLHAI